MNVLSIIWSLEAGGAEQVVIDLNLGFLESTSYKPLVACLNQKGVYADKLESEGIKVIPLFKKPNFDPVIILKIIKIIKQNKVDIVHTHLWTSNFWGRIAAWLAGVKVIVATEHTTDEKRPIYYYWADRILSLISDKIIAVSESVKNFHTKKTQIIEDKFQTIRNGIDIAKWQPSQSTEKLKKELGVENNDIIIGTIGRLVPAKNYSLFLQSFASISQQFSDAKAIIVGKGPLESELKNQAKSLGIEDKVIFTGFRQDIPKIFHLFDLFVLSSNREGLPITLLEAMASGVPAIVTRVGGNPEVITNFQNGILIKPNTPQQLTEAIENLLTDENLYSELSDAGRIWVKTNLSRSAMVHKTSLLYKNLLKLKINQKLPILFIIDHLDSGGAQKQMIELIKSLDRQNYNIKVCNLDKEKNQLTGELEDFDIQIFGLNQFGKFDLKTLISLTKFIRKNKFSLIHTYLFTADLYGRMAAFFARAPIILASMRSVDSWKKWYHVFVDRVLAQFTDKIIVNANIIKNFLVNVEKIEPKKLVTIYNGINLQKWDKDIEVGEVKSQLGFTEDEFVIGMLARNDPVKNHRTFFEAAKIVHARYPNIKFLAIGYGMQNKNMDKLTRKLKVDKFTIRKNYTKDVVKIIKLLDISVLTSDIEGCPNIILESMLMQKPVVATEVGGIPELVLNDKTGFLIPPRNPKMLADSLIQLYKHPNLRKRFGKNGHKRVKNKFSLENMVQDTEKIYLEFLKI